jgi:TRAP transporter TAXI family solute receptor
MNFLRYLAVVAVTTLASFTSAVAQESDNLGIDYTIIGGGRVSGLYFPAAGALCALFNRQSASARCYVESNTDSFANLRALRNGEIDFAIVQSDWVRQAAIGNGPFKEDGADEDLRTVFSLHGEALTMLARQTSGIGNSLELAGKRVNAGPQGTYQRLLTDWLLQAQSQNYDDLKMVLELPEGEQVSALCDGTADAIMLVTAHPSPRVTEIATLCGAGVIPIDPRAIDVLLKGRSDLSAITIPSGYYANNPVATNSFGLRAVMVTNERVKDVIVDYLVRSVFENLDDLRLQHPVFATLDAETMARDRSGAPLHKGAVSYFKERGWR